MVATVIALSCPNYCCDNKCSCCQLFSLFSTVATTTVVVIVVVVIIIVVVVIVAMMI